VTTQEKVQNGIKYLDENFEGWIDTFATEVQALDDVDIEVGSSNLHPVARVSGIDFNISLRKFYDTGKQQFLFDHGFDSEDGNCEELDEEWKNHILARLYSEQPKNRTEDM
jgi:hypothetical protein